jgi:hypoxanthine phosphoribosyltransferase
MSVLKTLQFKKPQEYKPGDVLIPQAIIQERIKELSAEIAEKYKGRQLLIVGVLKGAFKIVADLTSELHRQGVTDLEISFITMKSYPDGTKAKYEPRIVQDMDISSEGRPVLLVDDVLDTGRSLAVVHKLIKSRGAISVESFALVDKPERRQVDYKADYVGFTIPNIWLQGYGMDTAEFGRAEPNIIVGPHKYQV